jgi:hypothetical protein
MAKGQHLSGYQSRIVKRFYLHRDAVLIQRLQECVSDLAMNPTSDKLWQKAEKSLRTLTTEPPLDDADIDGPVQGRDLNALASLVGTLAGR